MAAAYNKYMIGFECPKIDLNFGNDKRIYQILDDKGMTVRSIILPIFNNSSGNLDDTDTFDGLYTLN